MTMKRYFTTKDLAFIGMIVALLFIVQFITIMTISAITPLPPAKSIVSAFFACIVIAIGLGKVKKIGTFSLISVINGIICGFIVPAVPTLFVSLIAGGIAADGITRIFYKGYTTRGSIVLACGVDKFVSTVVVLGLSVLFGFPDAILNHYVIICIALLCSALGTAGGFVGAKMVAELKKAGAISD